MELTGDQLKEELEEENAMRKELGKAPYSMDEWLKIRPKRIVV